ncbi:thiosulfate oxidation carrier protein SoxY [Malikia sp.]|uniref:thiosulfate oxidation carrier protein SoxY n=1 Tax=Malikia sp. TaxID=2070706 RepID=UPI00262E2CEA|nr:thiosulfate oxidation carrier protein SoxY [Malikia sp.]MDD2728051.1 thiosulfate oxidation carrier protein SoxY [Malikia sp.]
MPTRRSILRHGATVAGLLALTGLFPHPGRADQAAAFEASELDAVLAALGSRTPIESPLLALSGPDFTDNGASVPLGVSSSLADISMLLILVEKNPTALVALFRPGRGVAANFTVRAKLVESSEVYAVAITADGAAYFARKPVQVTQGACGT